MTWSRFQQALRNQILPLLLVIALLVLSAIFTPRPVTFRDFAATEVLRLLTSLLTITLFVERSLEVFVNTWRGPDGAQLDANVRDAEQAVAAAGPGANLADLQMRLATARHIKAAFKSQTQRLALWMGLTFGLVISAIGVRTLETFAVSDNLTSLPPVQLIAFRVVDVLLTGGLIAGGSEGLHKLTQVYTNFMDASAQRAAGNGAKDSQTTPKPASPAG